MKFPKFLAFLEKDSNVWLTSAGTGLLAGGAVATGLYLTSTVVFPTIATPAVTIAALIVTATGFGAIALVVVGLLAAAALFAFRRSGRNKVAPVVGLGLGKVQVGHVDVDVSEHFLANTTPSTFAGNNEFHSFIVDDATAFTEDGEKAVIEKAVTYDAIVEEVSNEGNPFSLGTWLNTLADNGEQSTPLSVPSKSFGTFCSDDGAAVNEGGELDGSRLLGAYASFVSTTTDESATSFAPLVGKTRSYGGLFEAGDNGQAGFASIPEEGSSEITSDLSLLLFAKDNYSLACCIREIGNMSADGRIDNPQTGSVSGQEYSVEASGNDVVFKLLPDSGSSLLIEGALDKGFNLDDYLSGKTSGFEITSM